MKRVKTIISFFMIGISSISAFGATITVPLPGLAGPLPFPGSKNQTFDAAMTFESIANVRVFCAGTIIPGLGCGDGVERPVYPFFEWPCQIQMFMDADLGFWAAWFGPYNGPFSQEKLFVGFFDATWDFLLNGTAQISAYLAPLYIIGGKMLQAPSGTITQAYLIIEGVPHIPLCLLKPDGGELLPSESTYTIEWADERQEGNCPGTYILEYTIDNGQNWLPIAAGLSGICHYDWTVPSAVSEQCLIRVTDANNGLFTDVSDAPFYIYQCGTGADGDFNGDCYVNFGDFAVLAAYWLVEECFSSNNWCGGADYDGSGHVTEADLSDFVYDWCMCGNPYDPSCSP